jgi:hypothetical protein
MHEGITTEQGCAHRRKYPGQGGYTVSRDAHTTCNVERHGTRKAPQLGVPKVYYRVANPATVTHLSYSDTDSRHRRPPKDCGLNLISRRSDTLMATYFATCGPVVGGLGPRPPKPISVVQKYSFGHGTVFPWICKPNSCG